MRSSHFSFYKPPRAQGGACEIRSSYMADHPFHVMNLAYPLIAAMGFERIPTEPPPRSAEASLAPCSPSPGLQHALASDSHNR